ncbi:MAG: hypothetical protein SGBAC_005520 [Bacillariaceae sp.]
MTEKNGLPRRRSHSHQGLRTSRRTPRKPRQQEEQDEGIGMEGEQELGGESDDDKPVRTPPRRSRSQNSLRQTRRRQQNRSLRTSTTDANALPDDQSVKSSSTVNTTKLNRTSRLRNRRSAAAATTEDRSDRSRSKSNSRRGLEGKGRRSVSGAITNSGDGRRPSVGAIAAGKDLGFLENSQRSSRSQRSLRSLGDSVSAPDEKFLKERKSRQDEILGQVLRKGADDDPSESNELDDVMEKPKSRARRPSLTRLTDARKRVQERMAKGPSDATRRVLSSDEEGEMDLNDDYDPRQLEDRQRTSLVQRVSNVVATPEKTRRKTLGSKSLSAGPLVQGSNKSNWDI